MNIAIAKFGQTIKFDIGLTGGTNDGGNHEPPLLYNKLFELNPQNNYYIIGGNNFDRMSDEARAVVNKNNNVFNCMKSGDFKSPYKYLEEHGVKLDAAIIFGGGASKHNLPQTVEYEKGGLNKSLLMLENYTAPIIYTLNKTNVPWLLITCDPRYENIGANDLTNSPKYNLSQINGISNFTYFKEFNPDIVNVRANMTKVTDEVPLVYAATETIMAIDSVFKKPEPKPAKKSMFSMVKPAETKPEVVEEPVSDFVIVANQSKFTKLDRLSEIKKYIGDLDVAIYGRYDDETVFEDKRFKGSLPLDELYKVLNKSEYTFIVPIDYDWATSKYIECINNNLIPFLHPVYDTQHNVKLPDYLRVNSPSELYDKINELRNNPDTKKSILNQCKSVITDDIRSGKFMNDMLNSYLNKIIKES